MKVSVKENEAIDRALKRFKKKMEKSGVLREYRGRQFFVKPSEKRRVEIGKAVYKQKYLNKNA